MVVEPILILVVKACLLLALLVLGLAGYALKRETDVQTKAQEVALAATQGGRVPTQTQVPAGGGGGLGDRTQTQGFIPSPEAVIDSLAKLATAFGGLRASVAALLVTFGLVIFAGIFAAVADKVPEPAGSNDSVPSASRDEKDPRPKDSADDRVGANRP